MTDDRVRTNTELPPIPERILRQVADIICKEDENVVVAARRLQAEVERLRVALSEAEVTIERLEEHINE